MQNKLVTNLKSFFSHISIDCLAVCLYFVCLPFTMVSTPFGSLLKLITIPVVAVLGVKLFIGKTKPLKFNIVQFAFAAYMLYCFCQLIYFREQIAVTVTSDMLQGFMVLLLVTLRVYNEDEQKLIEDVWIVVGIVCVILTLTSKEYLSEYEERTAIYILGYEEDPNQFSAYFTMSVVVAIKRIIEKSKFSLFYIGLLLAITYSVLKLGSRGGLIGILAGMAACVIFGAKSLKAKIGILIAGAIGVVIVVVVLFPLLPQDMQNRFTIQNVVETGGSGRTDIWKFCIQYTTEKPERMLFGSGVLSTYVIFPTMSEVTNVVAHNQFIQSFFDQGILGLSLYFVFYIIAICRNWRKKPFYAAAMVAMMAFSMSLTMYMLKPYFNVVMMCALNIEKVNESNSPSTPLLNERNDKNA